MAFTSQIHAAAPHYSASGPCKTTPFHALWLFALNKGFADLDRDRQMKSTSRVLEFNLLLACSLLSSLLSSLLQQLPFLKFFCGRMPQHPWCLSPGWQSTWYQAQNKGVSSAQVADNFWWFSCIIHASYIDTTRNLSRKHSLKQKCCCICHS